MANLTTTSTTGRPSILAAAAKERINSTFNRLVDMGGRREIAEMYAPTANEMTAMRGRLGDIARSMVPATSDEIETLIGALLAGYPVGRGHRDEVDAVLRAFRQALRDLPVWSISAACSAWNRGEVKGRNTSFAPAPADLRAVALEQTEEFDRERHKIKAILDAEVVPEQESDEKRAEVAARVKQWVKDREPASEANRKLSDEEFDAFAAKFRETLRTDPPHLSSLAKHAAGLIPAMQERRARADMDEGTVAPVRTYDEDRAAWDQQEHDHGQ